MELGDFLNPIGGFSNKLASKFLHIALSCDNLNPVWSHSIHERADNSDYYGKVERKISQAYPGVQVSVRMLRNGKKQKTTNSRPFYLNGFNSILSNPLNEYVRPDFKQNQDCRIFCREFDRFFHSLYNGIFIPPAATNPAPNLKSIANPLVEDVVPLR